MKEDEVIGRVINWKSNGQVVKKFVKTPYVILSCTQEGVCLAIEKCLDDEARAQANMSQGYRRYPKPGANMFKAANLFDLIRTSMRCSLSSEVSDYLDDWSDAHVHERNPPLEVSRSGILRHWYELRVVRRLYHLGLTKMELSKVSGSLSTLYRQIVKNPYRVLMLSIDKCNFITQLMGLKINPKYVEAGTIIRFLHEDNIKRHNRYNSYNYVFQKYPSITKVRQLLYDEFGVVFEDLDKFHLGPPLPRTITLLSDCPENSDLSASDHSASDLSASEEEPPLPQADITKKIPSEDHANDHSASENHASEDHASDQDSSGDTELNPEPYRFKTPLVRIRNGLVGGTFERPNDRGVNVAVYLDDDYQADLFISEWMTYMMTRPALVFSEPIVFKRQDLSEDQKNAINLAMRERVSILTGGGGVGKTTVIGELFYNNQRLHRKTAIMTSFGRASAVLNRRIRGCGASTIHRYLGNRDKSAVHLIIDEASTVNTDLIVSVITTSHSIEQVTLVGDDNQLMPIGPGCLFHELISSSRIPTYQLTVNHRFKVGNYQNGIVINANAIANSKRGSRVDIKPYLNFKLSNSSSIRPVVDAFIRSNIAGKNKKITTRDFFVVTPYVEFVNEINHYVQQVFRSGEYMIMGEAATRFYVEDVVRMKVNNYELMIFNGETGYVESLHSEEGYIVVDFAQEGDSYPKLVKIYDPTQGIPEGLTQENDSLISVECVKLGYAGTSHEVQGDEKPYVIVFIPSNGKGANEHENRNNLYVAITRGRVTAYLIGDPEKINAIASYWPRYGNDTISLRLSKLMDHIAPDYLRPVLANDVDTDDLMMW
jgi:hypothetical protein